MIARDMQAIAARVNAKRQIISVALGERKAELVLKNAAYINVFSNEIAYADIAIDNGLIAGVGEYSGVTELDMTGKVVCPGFIDAHIHIESTLLSPMEFARAVIPHGTTTVVADPHEIANVMGLRGIDYMLNATRDLPLDVRFMLPSCVPATPYDENGASLSWRDIDPYFENRRVLGLAELMNFVGVINGDAEPLEKIAIAQAHHRKIDGHAPGLTGKPLSAYVAAGVYSDHECFTLEGALERLLLGQFIMIREGTAARNLEALYPLLAPKYAERCMFATDDKHPSDLIKRGHIDYITRRAIELGADPIIAIKAATHTAARYFLMNDKGAIAPGYVADIAVLDDLRRVNVEMVLKRGNVVYRHGKLNIPDTPCDSALAKDTFHMPEVTAQRLKNAAPLNVIRMLDGQITTKSAGYAESIDVSRDILKLAVAERHNNTGHIGTGFVTGYGLKRGAVATSVSHDSHNIIAVGCSEAELAFVINEIARMRGGMAVVDGESVIAAMELPIAGIMSEKPLHDVNAELEAVTRAARTLGAGSGIDPFMTLAFMALPVIPELRVTTRGVFDVIRQEYV